MTPRPPLSRARSSGWCDLALVWENDAGLRPLTGVAEALASLGELHPMTGTRTPAEAAVELAQLSPAARAMLDHVEAGPGEADAGAARHTITPEEATTPAEELISRGLLVPGRPRLVRVPGEVQVALRGGHTTRGPVDVPPAVATSSRSAAVVDRAAAGAAFEAVRRVELVVDHCGARPLVALRTGAVSVRDLKAVADDAQLDEPAAALVLELAAAAGLLATWPDADGNPAWTPTEAFDIWCDEPTADRWVRLARAWLDTERLPHLVGSRDDAGKPRNALDPELTSRIAPETRRMTLACRGRPARRRGAGDRDGPGVPGRTRRVGPAPPAPLADRAGRGGARRVRPPRADRSGRGRVVRPGPAGRRRPGAAARAPAARARSTR